MRATRLRGSRLSRLGTVGVLGVTLAGALAGCGPNQQHAGGKPAIQPSASGSPTAATTSGGSSGGAGRTSGGAPGRPGTSGGSASGGNATGGQITVPPGSVPTSKAPPLPRLTDSQTREMSSVQWTLVRSQDGGRQLVVSTETTPCRSPVGAAVAVASDTVTVGLLGRRPPAGAMCAQYIQERLWTVTLPSPLAGKQLAHLAPTG